METERRVNFVNMGFVKFHFILTIFVILFTGCKFFQKSVIKKKKESIPVEYTKLIWYDDFNSPVLDSTKWTKIPRGEADWNRHMSFDPDCYKIKDGKLYLMGIVNEDTINDPRPYLTGGIYTKGKFSFQYGKVEIRAKLNCAQGAWPAMWMLSERKKYGAYPRNGEIDILEHLNYDDIIYHTTHSYYTLVLSHGSHPPHFGTTKIDTSEFNTFGLEWYHDRLVFTVNGEETFVYPRLEGVNRLQWPYDQPFYLLIDQQLGGNWVGGVNPDDLPVSMIIDWVKVYR